MADSEGTESAQIEDATKSPEKDQPGPINEEQCTEIQEEAPKASENGHQTDDPAPEGENKPEEQPEDNAGVEQAEEATPEVKEQETAIGSENGGQNSDKKEVAEEKPIEATAEIKTEQPKEEDKGLAATVSKFYNEHKENTREERKTSPIFYLRNFNNWVKSVLINEFMEKYKRKTFRNLSVLDLACGKGGDLLKWQKAKISNLVCADIAEVSIKQCEQRYKDLRYGRNHRRYNQSQKVFDAQFITADCTKENISDQFNSRNSDVQFDMTSCQFSLHYAFESPEQAEKMLENACGRLKPGGYFIGTIPCANEIINRLRQSEGMSFENDCYKITFTEKENFSLFGHKYDFHLEGVVDCPEFLVHFPLLEKMAKKFDLTLELAQGFHRFFEDHKDIDDYRFLLNRMNALETFPPRREGDKPVSDKEDAYTQAKEVLGEDDSADYRNCVGTLSKDEWEAAGLYMVFAFKKQELEPTPTVAEEVKTDVSETVKSEEQSVEKDDNEEVVDKKDEEKMEDDKNVEEQGTATKIDESVKNNEEISEGENADKTSDDADKKSEDADKTGDDADKKGEDAELKDEAVEIKDENGDKNDGDLDKKDEDADKKDEEDDKKDEDADKKDEVASQVKSEENASKDVSQESEAGEQADKVEEGTQDEKKTTPQRGRRKRSVGAAKDEASAPDEGTEATAKRATRKRKSTGGGEEEPPEKKKA